MTNESIRQELKKVNSARPVRGTIRQTAECANCGAQIIKDDSVTGWYHPYTGGQEC